MVEWHVTIGLPGSWWTGDFWSKSILLRLAYLYMFLLFYPFKKFSILKIFLIFLFSLQTILLRIVGELAGGGSGYEPLVDPQSDFRLQSLNPNSRLLIQTLNQTPDSGLWIQTSYSESRLYAYCFWRCLKAFGGSFFIVKESLELTWLKAGVFQSNYFFLFYIFFMIFFPFKGT